MLTPKADFPCGVIALMSRTVAAATLYRELLADITKDCGFAVLQRYCLRFLPPAPGRFRGGMIFFSLYSRQATTSSMLQYVYVDLRFRAPRPGVPLVARSCYFRG